MDKTYTTKEGFTEKVAGSDFTDCGAERYGAELLGLLLHFRAVRGRA